MTALPVPPDPSPLLPPLTAAEYAQVPETEACYELQEGAIVMAAKPIPRHQDRLGHLYVHLGGEFGYIDAGPVRGTFTTQQPFPARIGLARAG